jgi:hypothetical protein
MSIGSGFMNGFTRFRYHDYVCKLPKQRKYEKRSALF